jgi:hypothetical protein
MEKAKKTLTPVTRDALFVLTKDTIGIISGIYALGFHYHTLDKKGNCIAGQQYMLKTDFTQPLLPQSRQQLRGEHHESTD